MRLLFLAGDLATTSGWGTFCHGFLAQARARYDVECPPVRSLDRSWRLRELGLPGDVARLLSVARRSDLVHALVEPAAPLAWMLARLARKPYVISAHGTYADLAAYPRRQRALVRHAFHGATRVMPVSSYTASVARRSFGGELPIEVVPGGFTAPAVAAAVRTQNAIPRVLSVGVLKARKGFHTLIEAIARIDRPIACDIVGPIGSPSYRERLDLLVRTNGLGDRVAIHGRVSAERLADLYRGADLFVLAAEHVGAAFEGLGLVYLEALSYGVPVIGAEDSGAIDVIRPGENGLLVPPGSSAALAAAMAKILDDPARAASMRCVAPDSTRGFGWSEVGARMDAVWRAATQWRGSGP